MQVRDPMIAAMDLEETIQTWGRKWGVPDLAGLVTVEFSGRLRRSLGRYHPAIGRVRLASFLQEAPREVLEEVLCHELAHVAVRHRLGASARPHGPEWAELVRSAGFEPLTRAPAKLLHEKRVPRRLRPLKPGSARFEHRCPVCHTTRVAGRPVPSWRCAECLDLGLPGAMVISRLPLAGPGRS
jgi:predicted SprT family Zn-dependent metalloprotease